MENTNTSTSVMTAKSLFNRDDVKQKFQELLGKRSTSFITSVLQIVASNDLLQKADPASIYQSAAVAATLDLPLNNQLGFAYIVFGYDYTSDDYDWAPDGVMGHTGHAMTIEECKQAIDDYYFEGTSYQVERRTQVSHTITKFRFLDEAIVFCKAVGDNAANIRVLFNGEEMEFDSI